MNKAEIIKGLTATINGLNALVEALQADEQTEAKTATAATKPAIGGGKAKPTAKPTAKTTTAPAAEASTDGQTFTTAQLTGMKYNEFKKLASSLGVDCKGTRDEIMARVVATGVVTDAEGEAPAPVAKTTKPAIGGKSNKPAPVGKGNAKKADAPTTDEFDAQAEEIAKSTPVEDIISSLADVDVKATKLNYKKQLAKALREGLLSVGDDEEAGGEDGGEEVDENTHFAEYDLSGANDPDNMTEARAAACAEKQGAIIEQYQSGNLTEEALGEFIENNGVQEEVDVLGEDYDETDLLKLYIEIAKHYIDNDGVEHEPGDAYMIGEDAYCCGQPLDYDEKTGKFLCQHCGSDYEAE